MIFYICIDFHSLLKFFPIQLWTKSQVCELALAKEPRARKSGWNHRAGVLMRLLQLFILGSQPVFRTRSHRVNQAKAQVPSQESEPRLWAKPRSSHRISTSEQAPELLLNPWSSLRPCVLWRHSLATDWHSQRNSVDEVGMGQLRISPAFTGTSPWRTQPETHQNHLNNLLHILLRQVRLFKTKQKL